MTEKIEIRTDADSIDEVIMPGVHLEMMDRDQASLALTHNGEHLLIEITAAVSEDGNPFLAVAVADRWEE